MTMRCLCVLCHIRHASAHTQTPYTITNTSMGVVIDSALEVAQMLVEATGQGGVGTLVESKVPLPVQCGCKICVNVWRTEGTQI